MTRVLARWLLQGTAEAQLGWSESTPATATRPARQVPAKATDIVPAGSLTKSFTAAAILQLVDQGALVRQKKKKKRKKSRSGASLSGALSTTVLGSLRAQLAQLAGHGWP